MAAYLTLAGFRIRTTMPGGDVDAVEADVSGWIDAKLTSISAEIDARLAKRYATPFAAPYPEVLCDWLERIVTPRVYRRRGVNPADQQIAALDADAEAAWKAIAEAADSAVGLYDIPLRSNTTDTGIVKGTPLSYAEPSPYDFIDRQKEAIGQ